MEFETQNAVVGFGPGTKYTESDIHSGWNLELRLLLMYESQLQTSSAMSLILHVILKPIHARAGFGSGANLHAHKIAWRPASEVDDRNRVHHHHHHHGNHHHGNGFFAHAILGLKACYSQWQGWWIPNMVNLFFTLTIKVRSIHLQVMAISSECAQPLYKLGYETW